MKLSEINSKLNGKIFVNGKPIQKINENIKNISSINNINDIKENSIVYAKNQKILSKAIKSKAKAILIPETLKIPKNKIIIQCENHQKAFYKLLELFQNKQTTHTKKQIHQTAVIAQNTRLGKEITIMANTIIEDGVTIGNNTSIYPNCYIGNNTSIGKNSTVYPGVVIHSNCTIGDSVVIKSNTVIGGDGFGYHYENNKHIKIPQLGTVEIQDNVEIGSGVSIDRATIGKTLIGKGTKIDNLVQIAHNCTIGENCIIAGQTGLAGSVTLENNVTLAGQVGIVDHCHIGNNSTVMAKSMVNHSLPPKSTVFGYPARPIKEARKIYKELLRLSKNKK